MRRIAAAVMAFWFLLDVGGSAMQKKYAALTFDDGPTGKYTARLLDILSEKDVHATFFLCGYRVEQYPELTARIARDGHEIGVHGFSHRCFSELDEQTLTDELDRECFLIGETAGYAPALVRPPCGALPEKNHRSPLSDYAVILWSVDPKDWATDDRTRIVRRVISGVKSGDIILMHDASDSSVDAVAEIIDCLKAEGYTFVTVSELAAVFGVELEKCSVYHRFGG